MLRFPLLQDIAAAFMLLTRIPVSWPRFSDQAPDLARSLWAYPLVGAVVSTCGALVLWATSSLLPAFAAALLALLATVLLTGSFHEDGLADVADGFGGGLTKDRKLEIMRDSRLGTYGAVAVVFSLGLRASALTAIEPLVAAMGFVVAGALSRMVIVFLLRFMPPARKDGMGTVAGRPGVPCLVGAFAIGVGLAFWLLPAPWGAAMILAALLGAGTMALIARWQIGGYTGDVLGASQQVAETFCLLTLAALAAGGT